MGNMIYSQKLKNDLNTLSLWTKITAIIAFISAAVSLIISFSGPGKAMGGIVSVFISIAINIYLFKFSNLMKNALESANQEEANMAWANLKTYFLVQGVLMIIGLVLILFAFMMGGEEIMRMLLRGDFF